MKIIIRHELRVSLGGGVPRALQHLLLTPLSGPSQTVKDWSIDMPGIETASRFTDAFGNRALLVCQTRPEDEIGIAVNGAVETIDRNGILGRVPGDPVVALYKRTTDLTRPDPRFLDAFRDSDRSGPARIALFHAIMERLGELHRFASIESGPQILELQATGAQRQSQGGQTQSQAALDEGEAGDERPSLDAAGFSHAFIAIVRALDIPARYVTGYLAADEDHPAAFHAWAVAWDDSLGWIAFDTALGLCPTDRHVRIATGLDAASTQPVRAVPQAAEPRLLAVQAVASAQ